MKNVSKFNRKTEFDTMNNIGKKHFVTTSTYKFSFIWLLKYRK